MDGDMGRSVPQKVTIMVSIPHPLLNNTSTSMQLSIQFSGGLCLDRPEMLGCQCPQQ